MPLEDLAGLLDEEEGGYTSPDYGLLPGAGPLSQVGETSDPKSVLRRATVNLHATSLGGGAPTGLDLLRAYAVNQLPDREAILAARQKAAQAYAEQASAAQGLSPAGRAAPWFSFAGGLGSPLKTGSFSEGMGRGAAAMGQALERQAVEQSARDRLAAELRAKGANVEAEGVETDLKTSLPALSRMAAANRVAGAQRYKVVPRVGLVDLEQLDAAGNPRIVVRGDDTREVLSKFATGLLRVAGDPKRMKFGSPKEMMDWVSDQTMALGRRITPETLLPELPALVTQVLSEAGAGQTNIPAVTPAPAAAPAPAGRALPPALAPAGGMSPQELVSNIADSNAPLEDKQAALEALNTGQVISHPGPPADVPVESQNARELARVPPAQPPLPPGPLPIHPITKSYLPPAVKQKGPAMVDVAGQAGEISSAENEAKFAEEIYAKEITPAVDVARDMVGNVKLWRSLSDETSRAAAIQEWMGSWAQALGLDNKMVQRANSLQKLNKIMMQEVLRQQILQKGVQTEGDARRMMQAWAQIQNTPAANEFILRITEAKALRVLERAQFFDAYREEHQGSLRGAQAAWNKYIQATPLVGSIKGQAVFYNEWLPAAERANPNIDPGTLQREWRRLSNG